MTKKRDKIPADQRTAELCPLCKGHLKCPICAGTGKWYEETDDEEKCSACKGLRFCPECAGSGKVETKPH